MTQKSGKITIKTCLTGCIHLSSYRWRRFCRSVLRLPPSGLWDYFFHDELRTLRISSATGYPGQAEDGNHTGDGETQSGIDIWRYSGYAVPRHGGIGWVSWLYDLHSRIVYNKFQKYITIVFITESLRKYPLVPFLDRECGRDWKFPDSTEHSNVTLPRGTATYIPVYGIHHDPQYYADPQRFDPERFTQENVKKRHQFTYLPFGGGLRICLGEFHEHT